jgi:hypothetical protein
MFERHFIRLSGKEYASNSHKYRKKPEKSIKIIKHKQNNKKILDKSAFIA